MFFPSHSYLYQIAHLGDDDDEPEFSSAMPLEEGDTFFFQPRPLKNLVLVDEQENLSPIMACQVTCLFIYLFVFQTCACGDVVLVCVAHCSPVCDRSLIWPMKTHLSCMWPVDEDLGLR